MNIRKSPFLYSAGTLLAYTIAKEYYANTHYVWCTTKFNSLQQPPTSNPATICRRFLEQIRTRDRHTQEIQNNIVGILNGAKKKFESGVITEEQYNAIKEIVAGASYSYEAFFPVLYIIESRKVKERCEEVPVIEKASDEAVEYRIRDLKEGEFELISFKDIILL